LERADEELAQRLQKQLDDSRSEEVAKQTLKAAKSNPSKGKPAKSKKKSPKRAPASSKETSRFHVDIGETKFTSELDRKLLSKPLLEVVCTPALTGYLADKPACVRVPIGAHPEDVTITVNGEVVDGKSAAKDYVDSSARETIIILILPEWATDVIQRNPAVIAEIVGTAAGKEHIESSGIHTTTITTMSAPFHINIGNGRKNAFETETCLNAVWLQKPLMDALIVPALNAFAQSNPSAPEVDVKTLKMAVDGTIVNGSVPAIEYVRADGSPALLELTLPNAGASYEVEVYLG